MRSRFNRGVKVMVSLMRDDMNGKVIEWYKRKGQGIAQDSEGEIDSIEELLAQLGDYWADKFDKAAVQLGQSFSWQTGEQALESLQGIFRDMGITVDMSLSPRVIQQIQEAASWSTSLIKSIPGKYLGGVQRLVEESVQKGRDVRALEEGLKSEYQVTTRRAQLIAEDQVNKVTQGVAQAKMKDAGITRGRWQHNAASKTWRQSHVKMDGQEFNLEEGCWDPVMGKFIKPGELPYCRCSFVPVIPDLV
jgi:SPP1 gp7 family putative phage head morphogenesis protein